MSDKEERISINLTKSELNNIEELSKELNLRGIKIKNKSDALRLVIKCALDNREKLDNYLDKKQAAKNHFNPEKDGFKSEAFAGTFIDRLQEKLKLNLLLNAGTCRVYAGRDMGAEVDRHNGGLIILRVKGQKRKTRAKNCRVSFSLRAINKVQIFDTESGERQEYRYLPSERFPSHKAIELDLEYGDVNNEKS